jgi:hypothetical protein
MVKTYKNHTVKLNIFMILGTKFGTFSVVTEIFSGKILEPVVLSLGWVFKSLVLQSMPKGRPREYQTKGESKASKKASTNRFFVMYRQKSCNGSLHVPADGCQL